MNECMAADYNPDVLLFGPGACFEVFYNIYGEATEGVMGWGAWNENSSTALKDLAERLIAHQGERNMDWWGMAIYYAGLQVLEPVSYTHLDVYKRQEYTYLIPFTPVAGANAYRVCSNVTITNHSGHLGEDFGPGEKDGFELPGSPVNKEIDAAASITDQLQGAVPAGFAAEYLTRTWNLPPDTSPFSYTLSISNISAEHGSSFALTNCATLTTCDSKSEQKVTATVTLLTPEVPDEPDEPDVPDEPDEPDEPDVPDEPDEPGEPEKPKPKPLPRTGGGAAVLMLFGLCSLGAGALLLRRKKR